MTEKTLFSARMKQLAAVVFLLTFNFISAQAPTFTSFSPCSSKETSTSFTYSTLQLHYNLQ